MAPIDRPYLQARERVDPSIGQTGTVDLEGPSVNLGVFLAILGATVTIFILTVICWKFGAFARLFSRHKVLGGGETAAIPYAKTWHGWIPLAEHDRRRAQRKKRLSRLREKMAWRSCHADYSWVWWDPESSKFNQHTRNQDGIRWMPRCLMSYKFAGADPIWNPGPPGRGQQSTEASDGRPNEKSPIKQETPKPVCSGSLSSRAPGEVLDCEIGGAKRFAIPRFLSFLNAFWRRAASLLVGKKLKDEEPLPHPTTNVSDTGLRVEGSANGCSLNTFTFRLTRAKSVPLLAPASKDHFSSSLHHPSRRRCVSDGQQGDFIRNGLFDGLQPMYGHSTGKPSVKYRTWKYKVLGTRMHRRGFDDTPLHLMGLAGRPGSPVSEALNSMVSSPPYSECYGTMRENTHQRPAVSFPVRPGYQSNDISDTRFGFDHVTGVSTMRLGGPRNRSDEESHFGLHQKGQSPISTAPFHRVIRVAEKLPRSVSEISLRVVGNDEFVSEPPTRRRRATSDSGTGAALCNRITNPELRLLDDLDRRLEWLSSEVDPGRKQCNYSLVHNHWLNRATWTVYDPVSRVGPDRQRMFADSRFNNPLPHPEARAKLKYPVPTRPKADTPRIDSWRLAINRARKSSGLREFLKAVELFEGSVDEPAEGAIDPATWILRRPPQGYDMSSKQKNAYYEGGSGWCEKLTDWQTVKSGYRIRKAVYEGKVNRRRVVELARSVGGGCRTAARHVTPAWASRARTEKGLEKQRRRERSGYGSIPRRRHGEKAPYTPSAFAAGLRRRPTVSFVVSATADCAGDKIQVPGDQTS